MHPLLLSLLQYVYPLPEPNLIRDRPLEVLALGLSRSGTESLRQALFELGYNDVHHGYRFILNEGEALQWLRLCYAQETCNTAFLNRKEFDKVLGDCAAVTDVPSYGFAHELIDQYPDARIILNYRGDIEAWHKSVERTIEQYNAGWYDWLFTFFQSAMFWHQRTFWWTFRRLYKGDFQKYGREWYREHYEGLEKRLPAGKYLKWRVEDGWEPLCTFLNKPVPENKPFPSGNTPKEFEVKLGGMYVQRRAEAERNLKMAMIVAAAASIVPMAYLISSIRR